MTSDWILLLILLQPPVFGHLTVTPINQVSTVGSRVTFHCQTDIQKPITWSHTEVGRQLSVDIRNRDGYSIRSNDSRNYYFTIDSVTLKDAGVHAWTDNDGFGTAFGIILVVIHEVPSGVTNVTHEGVTAGNAIQIVCSVGYRGNMKAIGHWIDPSGPRITASEDEISSLNDTKVFRRLVTVDVAQGKRQAYRFLLSFTVKDKSRPNFAVNDPDQNYTWTSPEVNVLFPVSNIRVNVTGEDDPVAAYLGETVTCSAEGNPEVQFHWEELDVVRSGEDRSIATGPHLTLNASGRHRYRCIAQNTVRNKLHRLTSKNISVNVLPRIQSTSSQSVNSRTDDGGVTCCVASSADVNSSLAEESSENRSTGTLPSANSSVIHWISSDASTERMNLLSESTLFFLTLVMGSALIVGIVASVVCLVVSKMRKRRRLVRLTSSETHYLTVARNTSISGEGKFADDLGCRKDQLYGYTECRKSDIYEEINDSEVIDGSKQRPDVHLREQGQWTMPSLKSTARHENSADDEEIITMESSYITCPATLPASDSVSISDPLYIDVCM